MFVISFGNHWLQADENLVHQEFVSDLCKATLHTKEFAQKYVADARKCNKRLECLEFKKALEQERNRVNEAVKSTWLNTFVNLAKMELGDRISKVMFCLTCAFQMVLLGQQKQNEEEL